MTNAPTNEAAPISSQDPKPQPEYLTVDEAAVILRVNRKTLYDGIKLGQVPGVVRIGRAIRIKRVALVASDSGNGGPALGGGK